MKKAQHSICFDDISGDIISRYPHLEKYNDLRYDILKRERKKFENFQLKDYVVMSANLQNFLPEVPTSEYHDIYMNILLGRALLNQETHRTELIDRVDTHNMEAALAAEHLPAVFCTYHLGSYRSIIGLLAKMGIPFVLIVDANTYHKQQARVKQQVAAFHKTYRQEGVFFDMLNAELPNSAMSMMKYLREGVSIVAYIDGNTGGGGIFNKNERFQLKIPFLNQEIYSRKGIATISWMSKRPLIPVISYYQKDSIRPNIKFYDPVFPDQWSKAGQTYVPEITRKLYRILESYLVEYYDQWETWFYLHKYLDADKLEPEWSEEMSSRPRDEKLRFSFNKTDFDLFRMDRENYLFNKRTYQTYPIHEELFDILHQIERSEETQLIRAGLDESLIDQLWDNGIIHQQ
jgi:KDO2-lipid IV(A) lauroyltransferase